MARAKVILETTRGPLSGKRFVFEEHDTFIFGREADCHAHLAPDDTTASRHHFLLELDPPAARLRDLASLNGTFVNGLRYGGRAPGSTPSEAQRRASPQVDLKHGDVIEVGTTTFTVIVEQAQGRAAPTVLSAQPMSPASLAGAPEIPGYDVTKKLGEGGMGAVYLGRRHADGSAVAIKIMLPHAAVTDTASATFLREIEVTRTLSHPNIVRIYEHGPIGSAFFFAMELCSGGSVDQLLDARGGRLGIDETMRIAIAALEGLAFAHTQGFVHRDIKPQNILLGSDGRARLSDFGLAKSFTKAGLSGMTATGAIAGTPFFMPREQLINFKFVTPVSDVWSLAATIYFMLTGKPPRDFDGKDVLQVILGGGTVPIRSRDTSIPGPLAAVIDRALSDAPEARHRSGVELLAALREVSGTR